MRKIWKNLATYCREKVENKTLIEKSAYLADVYIFSDTSYVKHCLFQTT